jgi:hypothetical protein
MAGSCLTRVILGAGVGVCGRVALKRAPTWGWRAEARLVAGFFSRASKARLSGLEVPGFHLGWDAGLKPGGYITLG